MIIARRNNSEDVAQVVGSLGLLDNYSIVETLPQDYTDETNVPVWYNILSRVAKDYIFMRDFAKTVFLPNFDNLTQDEKKKLVQHYIYPDTFTQAEIDAMFTAEEQIANWEYLTRVTQEARNNRWEVLRKRISFDLSVVESMLFYNDTKEFKGDYIDVNLPNLILWLTNGSYPPLGIDYTTNGFAQKSYYSVFRKGLCVEIIQNGNY